MIASNIAGSPLWQPAPVCQRDRPNAIATLRARGRSTRQSAGIDFETESRINDNDGGFAALGGACNGRLAADMATKKQCEAALRGLAKRLDGVDDSLKKRHAPDRTLSCRIPDLDTAFSGRLSSGVISDFANEPIKDAQIRLTVCSDDLLAMTKGDLPLSAAWATGKVKIEASVLDMIRLRAML